MQKYTKHNSPRKRPTGQTLKRCARCGRYGAHVGKYHIGLCRCCFRELATAIGFNKYS
ncbi:30S ribosomal protein S14 [Candidatus Woesearchaeota archaeon]|nr:30S ribosomal protein S14 [Candidatus Woesearchaeota archaeon]